MASRRSWLEVLVLLSVQVCFSLKCYVGETSKRNVDEKWGTTQCNNTVDIEYDRCYSICQSMVFQNQTWGGGGVQYNICKHGCASVELCNIMQRRQTGMFIVDPVCPCYWSSDDVYWTTMLIDDAELLELGEDYISPAPPPFCCPMCRLNVPGNPESCPEAFGFVQKCCSSEGCNVSGASKGTAAWGLGLVWGLLVLAVSHETGH